MQFQGWDGHFLPCVWNKASLQREKAVVDMQSYRQETKTAERQCSRYYHSLSYRLPLLHKLKAGPLDFPASLAARVGHVVHF